MPEDAVRFIADNMVGRLAKWLRILGYDTEYSPRWDDNELARRSRAEGRVLLTRDGELAQRQGLRSLLIESDAVEEQLAQVVTHCALSLDRSFSRCPVCNTTLDEAARHEAFGRVPPYVFATQKRFRLCPTCNQFFWQGTHWQRMRERIEELAQSVDFAQVEHCSIMPRDTMGLYQGESKLDSLQVARDIVDIAVARLASDTLLLDVREVTLIADYFLLCSGSTKRQLNAVTNHIVDSMKEQGVRPRQVEGTSDSGWQLLDYGDVIVHVMTPAIRELYDLEGLWKGAKTVIRIE